MLFTDNESDFAKNQIHQEEIDDAVNDAVNEETRIWINMSVAEVASLNSNVMAYIKQLERELAYYKEFERKTTLT